MKLAKRLLSLTLVLLMVLALVACTTDPGKTSDTSKKPSTPGSDVMSGKTDDPGTVDPPVVPDFVLPDRPVSDMAEKEFIIIQHGEIDNPFGYNIDSRMAEYANARLDEVKALYNCEIEFEQVPYNDSFANAMQQRVYMDNSGDMIFSTNNSKLRQALGTGPENSLMVDLLALDNILNFWDMDKWGNIDSRETMMAGGHFYGVTPALWIDRTPLPIYLLIYNKDMLERFNVPDLQEYWEKEEWDRDVMVDAITRCYDDTGSDIIFGMAANIGHMVRATLLTTGKNLVEISKINADGTADWEFGMMSDDAQEALLWLRQTLSTKTRYFNRGAASWSWTVENSANGGWGGTDALVDGKSAMCLTRPDQLFTHVVTKVENFGLMLWAGADPNIVSGYYENACSVAIPVFAQNPEWSAFLAYDLFEGLGEIEKYSDVIDYYRETYFDTDLDVEFLLRDGVPMQYCYWPNKGDAWLTTVSTALPSSQSPNAILEKARVEIVPVIEEYILPNKIALEAYRQAGKID